MDNKNVVTVLRQAVRAQIPSLLSTRRLSMITHDENVTFVLFVGPELWRKILTIPEREYPLELLLDLGLLASAITPLREEHPGLYYGPCEALYCTFIEPGDYTQLGIQVDERHATLRVPAIDPTASDPTPAEPWLKFILSHARVDDDTIRPDATIVNFLAVPDHFGSRLQIKTLIRSVVVSMSGWNIALGTPEEDIRQMARSARRELWTATAV